MIIFYLLSLSYIDMFLTMLYTPWIHNVIVIKALMYFNEIIFLLVGLILFYKVKMYKNRIGLLFIIQILLFILYSVISFMSDFNLIDMLHSIRYAYVPYLLFIIGYYISIKNLYTTKDLLKYFIISISIISIFGLIEIFILDLDFFTNFYNTSNYYTDIKGFRRESDTFYGGSLSRPEFALMGIGHRLFSVFAEPSSAGVFFGASFLLILSYIILYKEKSFTNSYLLLLLVIIFIDVFLTQSRVGLLFISIGFIFLSKNKYGFAAIMIILSLIIFYIITHIDILEYIYNSITTLGGKGHKDGILMFYEKLFDFEWLFGHGVGIILTQETGWGLIYSQYGYSGLLLFAYFLFYILNSIQNSNVSNFEKKITIIFIVATIVILNFSVYSFTFKSYNIIWALLGFIYANSKKDKRIKVEHNIH